MNWNKVIEALDREANACEEVARVGNHHPESYWKNMTVAAVAATMAKALRAGVANDYSIFRLWGAERCHNRTLVTCVSE